MTTIFVDIKGSSSRCLFFLQITKQLIFLSLLFLKRLTATATIIPEPFQMSASIAIRHNFFRSPYMMSLTILVFFIAFSSSVYSSPLLMDSNKNLDTHQEQPRMNDHSAGLTDDSNDDQASLFSSNMHHANGDLSSIWYAQPRAHANQFLSSHFNDIDPLANNKWWRKSHHDNQLMDHNLDFDDSGDYFSSPSLGGFHKRSAFVPPVGTSHLKKRKQLNKPPMEVMNEIVNSIYLKR